jgi:hypothetical protein
MSEFIGVLSLLSPAISLKREAIIFRRLAIPELSFLLEFAEASPWRSPDRLNELLWLIDQGIVFEPEELQEERNLLEVEEYKKLLALEHKHLDESENVWLNEQANIIKRLNQSAYHSDKAYEYYIRRLCVQMRLHNMDAHPILREDLCDFSESSAHKSDVVQVIVNELPIPDDLTPWDYIIEFQNDPDTERKFANIRNWMDEIAQAKISRSDVEDKLRSALSDYQEHMRLHRIKTNLGTLKTFIVTEVSLLAEAGLLGLTGRTGLVGMISAPFFLLKQRKVKLLEGELNALGRELAYIIKARETFS